jgi:RimJ/RimL family protein N-acetyltransferase
MGEWSLPQRPLMGEVVVLRPWRLDEAEWYVSARDEEVFRFTGEERETTAEDVRSAWRANTAYPSLAIVDASNGALLGALGFAPVENSSRTANVAYWLAPKGRGRGAVTDAVNLIVTWAFEKAAIECVELRTRADNSASQAVAGRCGFRPAGMRGDRLLFIRTRDDAAGNS